MRLIDADELMEHAWRDKLDSRELIAKMIDDAPTVKEISTKIPINVFEQLISQESKTRHWIPVSERLPENLQTVNVTWQNHEPEPYYHDIKDRSFVATAVYYNEDWYWYSTTCADYLGEYGRNDVDKIDEAIEIIAWMPLPEPYKVESEE